MAITAPRHKLIEQQRLQLGIGIAEFARQIGASVSEYRDVESYDNEPTIVLPLKKGRSLAEILGFEIGSLLGAGSLPREAPVSSKPRHVTLVKTRRSLGVSTKKMADDLGFDEGFVHTIENDRQALETYPYEVLRIVASYLKLDPKDLLYSPSP